MDINLLKNKPLLAENQNVVLLIKEADYSNYSDLNADDVKCISRKKEAKQTIIPLFNGDNVRWVVLLKEDLKVINDFRNLGADFAKQVQGEKIEFVDVDASAISKTEILAFAQGFVLENYQFLKYFKDEDQQDKKHIIQKINLFNSELSEADTSFENNLLKAVYWARNVVNEPVNYMNATQFANEVIEHGKETGLKVEVFDKKKIESLRMGGLLSVNKGSIDPPTFTICEWKPENASNTKPYVLVGKGVMYDTGGLSLKPTANSMDYMKSDMGGAAAVAGTLYSVALNKLPIWVIGILPATDNRPDGNAYAPGDIIKMYNRLHVEVMNTDAEGRLILADGLSYGDKYDPELIVTVATLTGNAAMAVGSHGTVFMGNADKKHFDRFTEAGENSYERLVRFPFWNEYGEALKTNIADLKNLGTRDGGAISAGKFLEHFTTSPYIHFDIAGPAFLTSAEKYKPKGASGVGVRLFTEFFRTLSK